METRFEFRDFLKVFGLAIVLFVFFATLLKFIPGSEHLLDTLHPAVSFLIQYLIQFVILFCPLWIFVVGKYNATWSDFGFKKISFGPVLKNVFLAYVIYLVSMFILNVVLSLTGGTLPGYEAQESYLPLFGTGVLGLVVGFILVSFLAPFIEEILFRGFVYRIFVKTWPNWIGNILSAALFALIHVQFQTFIPLFILGLLLNHVYKKTDSLWTSFAFHSLNNILAFAVEVYLSLHPEVLERLAQVHTFLYTIQIS